MTQGEPNERTSVQSAGFPAGFVSYVDRDWLVAVVTQSPSLSFAPNGEFFWCGHRLGQVEGDTDLTVVAAGALLGVAREAVAAVAERLRGAVEVVGTGLVAAHVRRLVANGGGSLDNGPGAVVDTTGDPETIRSALERVSDLGTVVLAGEAGGRTLDLDLYSSVHRRGLVLTGVAPPLHGVDVPVLDLSDEDLVWCRGALGEASSEMPVLGDSLWYRIVA